MAAHSKRYRNAVAEVDKQQRYDLDEAVELVKGLATANFDETVEITLKLGIDPKHSDQVVRGAVSLPAGTGKSVRVVAFAEGEDAEKAKEAGALEAGGDELVEKVQGGWMDFDVAVAHPQMMSKVGRLGRILGPRGLMPSPKAGTVTENVAGAVKAYLGGRVEYRVDDSGCLHVPVGKASFPAEDLKANVTAFMDHLTASRPAGVRGAFLQGGWLSTTMSPAVPLNVGQFRG